LLLLLWASGVVRVGGTADGAESPPILPELVGGISPSAVFRTAGFFDAARPAPHNIRSANFKRRPRRINRIAWLNS